MTQLTPEQQEVVDCWGRGQAILAGAGSGKTTTLVIKCAELLNRKPDARFAAVSFTEKSASDLREKLSLKLGTLGRHWVMTIHGLCGAVLRDFPREAGFDGEESMLSEPEAQVLWERATEALWLDAIPSEVEASLDLLLQRESQQSLLDLIKRVRSLELFGVLEFLAQGDAHSQALEKVARFVLERYERQKRRMGAMDFNDLERGADRALESEEVRAALHKRFDLVMVDEFQDTNPVQARIIRRFVRPDASNLCVVGDPKQSIYRFRDADVSVFEDFCSKLPVRQSLTWNFRSRPGIIDFTNQVCATAFEASEMRYEALVPQRQAREDKEQLDPVVRLDVREPSQLAQWILSEVERGIPLHEMALLVRRIRGNEKWFKALTSAGIPIAMGSGGLFWEDSRVRELTAFLRWWDNPSNSLSGATFMRSPWMGIPDRELDEWVRKDPTWVKPFFESGHPVAVALSAFRHRQVRPAELLMALLVNPEVEDEIGAPLMGLWHRSEELSARGLDFHRIASEFSAGVEEGRRERDVPPPENQGQLKILTLHSSKGLEFPHVILIDLAGKTRAQGAPLLFWDREKGAYFAARDAVGDRLKKDAVESEWRRTEEFKSLAESKRLFYVALTRAKERLVLVFPETDQVVDPERVMLQDNWRGWIEVGGAQIPSAELPVERSRAVPGDFGGDVLPFKPLPLSRLAVQKRPRHSVTEWLTLVKCPRAYEWTYIRPLPVPRDFLELNSKEIGTRVHACLARGDLEGLHKIEEEAGSSSFQAEPLIRWAQTSSWMEPADPARGREIYNELKFEIPVDGEVLVGALDRLVVEDSRYWIVDYKVTREAGTSESLLAKYRFQLELYSWALGVLEPAAQKKTEAVLVNISGGEVQTVPVPIHEPGREVPEILRQARAVIGGESGEPKPGEHCGYCPFRKTCQGI